MIDKRAIWADWRSLVNVSQADLRRFLDSPVGKTAGIGPGRLSGARIYRMRGKLERQAFGQAEHFWSAGDWRHAQKVAAFIKRHRAGRGELYSLSARGELRPTRKLLALLVWGHDAEKYDDGKRAVLLRTPSMLSRA